MQAPVSTADHSGMKKTNDFSILTKRMLIAWHLIGAVFLFASLAVYLAKGARAFEILISDVPHSDYYITLLATLIVWWLAGVFVHMLHFGMFNEKNAVLWSGFSSLPLST